MISSNPFGILVDDAGRSGSSSRSRSSRAIARWRSEMHAAVEQLLRALLVERRVVVDLDDLALRAAASWRASGSPPSSPAATPDRRPCSSGTAGSACDSTSMTLSSSSAWCAVSARPDSLMMCGIGRSRSRHASRDRVDDVVGVLLQRVVHARVRRGVGAVVVHAQPAADVDVRDVHAQRAQLDVEARDLLQRRLDEPDVGDLAAEVEVDQLQDVQLARGPAGGRSASPARRR